MGTPMTPADLLVAFEKLDPESNEAETRLKLIDSILFQVLGWTHDDVKVEDRAAEDGKTSYTDYIVRTAMTSFVIEAKRIGIPFDLNKQRKVHLRGSIMHGPTGDAIKQARDYARSLSVGFAIVTNGNQWIIFPVNRRDEISFADSSAIIFHSKESILRDDYSEFRDLLSRESVINLSLENELLGRKDNELEVRRLNRFHHKSFTRKPQISLYSLTKNEIDIAFTEEVIANDPKLLEKCYVTTAERIRFDTKISMHIARRESLVNAPKRPMKSKDGRALIDIIAESQGKSRPIAILIMGPVGVGKTTFLNYTRQVSAASHFDSNNGPRPHWIYIDYRELAQGEPSMPFLQGQIQKHISKDTFLSDYEKCIRHAYKDEIDTLFRGPLYLLAGNDFERSKLITGFINKDYEQLNPYNEKILRYAAENAPIFLVIDNVDQFEDVEYQTQLFSTAIAFSRRINANLILPMRDSTYVKHRSSPMFDAFDFDALYIDPPKVESVLSKRFFVARQLLSGKKTNFINENGVKMDISDSSIIIDLIQSSVLGTEVGEIIDVMATSDIRLALRMTREFLRYGYTSTGHALKIYQETGKYIMPKHEALRAIMLGNQDIYNSDYSVISNPFDAYLARAESQLLRIFILNSLVNYSSKGNFSGVDGDHIKKSLREIGVGDDVTLKILIDLCNSRFIQTSSYSPATFNATFIPTRLGGYIIRDLIANFTFIENCMMDTFISEKESWDKLKGLMAEVYSKRDKLSRLEKRISAARIFFDYMKRKYSSLKSESLRRSLPSEWCTSPFETLERVFNQNLDQALSSAKRLYSPTQKNLH